MLRWWLTTYNLCRSYLIFVSRDEICYSRPMMNAQNTSPPLAEEVAGKKRGRKPIGDKPMSGAERQRRSKERRRPEGPTKSFMVTVEGLHLEHIEKLAEAEGISASAAFRSIAEPALDRFVGVMRRASRLLDNGRSEDECLAFIKAHLFPQLPPMEEAKTPADNE